MIGAPARIKGALRSAVAAVDVAGITIREWIGERIVSVEIITNNRLYNAGFETDPLGTSPPTSWLYPEQDGWVVNNDYAAPGSSGTKSFGCEWTQGPGVYPTAYIYQEVPIPEGITLIASLFVRLSSFSNANWTGPDPLLQYVYEDDARIHLKFYDEFDDLIEEQKTRWIGDAYNRGLDYVTYLGANWFKIEEKFTAPEGTAYVRFQIDGGDANNQYVNPETGHSGNAAIWMDDTVFYEEVADRTLVLNRATQAAIGVVGVTARVYGALRSATASVNVVGTTVRGWIGTRAVSATTSIVGTGTRMYGALRSATATMGIVGATTRIKLGLRTAAASIGVVGTTARSFIGSRFASATVSVV